MSSFKEIVTKTIIGKGKKTFRNKYTLISEEIPDTVLGCWIINHKLSGTNDLDKVIINGSYDVNIWYSCNNNTRTNVISKRIDYEETVKINLKEDSALSNDTEIILRNQKNPTCVDVNVENDKIIYVIEKEIGIELIGDSKVKIAVEDEYDDYEVIEDEVEPTNEVMNEIEENVNEEYLSEAN